MSADNVKNLTLTAVELFEQKDLYIGKLLCFVSEQEKEKFLFLLEIKKVRSALGVEDLYSIHSLKKTSIVDDLYYNWANFIIC